MLVSRKCMEINDLIFKELLKRGCKLEGKTRVWDVADSKLWYLTPKQAQGFLDLSKTAGYKKSIIEKEVSLIKKHMDYIVHALPQASCNIIDLGCGDGKKASLFIKELAKHMKIRYCPIDISSYMVTKAAGTIRKMKVAKVLEFNWNISDFENLNNITPLFRDTNFETHFMMLLGNTLGNFDRDDLLDGIKKSMKKDDVLIIGNGLDADDKETYVTLYRDTLMDKFLIKVIEQIGLSRGDVRYDVRFKNSRVEMFYTANKDKSVKHLNKQINFKKGDVILTAISYKYAKPELKKILGKFFSEVKIYTDPKETYALALCKR